jgi:hypothetical protein
MIRIGAIALLLAAPGMALAQSPASAPVAGDTSGWKPLSQLSPSPASSPPIGQRLVREGTLAVDLYKALGLGTRDDEVEAETVLGDVGIIPSNGWIADYPVTPDIMGELYQSVRDAAAANRIPLGVDEAQRRLTAVFAAHGLALTLANGAGASPPSGQGAVPPPPGNLDNYYLDQGPPVVTYYEPPGAYSPMYSWVAYPFVWGGFGFSGFYVLNDFHRSVTIRNRPVFVSNHVRGTSGTRVFRINPSQRVKGASSYSGIGARPGSGFSAGNRSAAGVTQSPRILAPETGVKSAPRSGPSGGAQTSPDWRGSGSFGNGGGRGGGGFNPGGGRWGR